VPVGVLSRVFRGKYLERLRAAFDQGQLRFPGRLARLSERRAFEAWLRPLYAKDWVVYSKPPFGGPAQVLKYLARYTHRVAISNARLVSLENGQVTFRYKDYADANRSKTMTLPAEEFLRRFMQHVLPRGFVKIRHYGLLANRQRAERLAVSRRLLGVQAAAALAVVAAPDSVAVEVNAAALPHCPQCGGTRLVRMDLSEAEQANVRGDTS
jgi:hypothetical protein